MSTRESNVRLKIESISDLDSVAEQYRELIKLSQQHAEATKQATLSARTNSVQEIAAINSVTEALKAQQQQQKKTDDEAAAGRQKTDKDLKALGDGVRNFATLIGTAFAISEIKGFGLGVIEAKTKIDDLKISLDVLLGSKKESAALYEDVVKLAKTTPFSVAEVADQVVKLKAYNIATADLIPTVTALGNIASAVGKDKLPQLTLAYGQVATANRLMLTELRQFNEAGVPLLSLIQSAYGKTQAEVQKMADSHEISFAMVRQAIMKASEEGGKYANLMVLQSKTVGGEVRNLSDSYDLAKARIGDFFQDTIQKGTRSLATLTDSLLGSNSAITRTIDIVKAAAAALVTYQLATNGAAAASALQAGYEAAKNVIYGTYLLTLRAVTQQQVVYTASQMAATTAATNFGAALALNPITAAIGAIALLTTAYYAYKAATDEVTSSLGENELKLKDEQAGLNTLANAAMNATVGTKQRKEAIELLISKYPQYFSGLSAESTNNMQLKSILDAVNGSYAKRIDLAREAYKTDELSKQRMELFQREKDFFDSIKDKSIEIQFGGNIQKFVDTLRAGGAAADDLREKLNHAATNGAQTFAIRAREINNEFIKIERASAESNERSKTANDEARAAEVDGIRKHYAALIEQANGNKTKIATLKKQELDEIAKATGTFRAEEVKAVELHEEKTKTIRLFSAKEEAAILKGAIAETVEERIKALNADEAAEREHLLKVTVNRKISNEQLAALREDAEKKILSLQVQYQALRAVLEKEAEEQKFAAYLLKARETEDKIAVIKKQQLEAQAILDKLNAAQTFEERLALYREYGTKIGDELKAQAVVELKAQRDLSEQKLIEVRAEKGVLSQAYRDAHAQFLKDDQAYEAASLALTKDTTQEKLAAIKEAEKQIQEAHKETAAIYKEIAKIEVETQKNVIGGWLDLASQADGAFGEIARGVKSAAMGIIELQKTSTDTAQSVLDTALNSLSVIQGMYTDGSAEGAAMVAKAEEDVAKAKQGLAEAEGLSAQAALGLFAAVYQILSTVSAAINNAMTETANTISESLNKTRDAYANLYDFVQQASAEAYKTEMENFRGTLDERIGLINEHYAKEKEFAEGRDRIDAALAYAAQINDIQKKGGQNAGEVMAQVEQARVDYANREQQRIIASAELNIKNAGDVRDAKIKAINDELTAFIDAKDKEIEKINETLAKDKEANEVFYSDKQLRLQEDDAYRAQLLQQGETREVNALEAAKQREIQRAIESNASAEEVANITNAFNELIKNKHKEYQDAIGNKTLEVSLAIRETKEQEKGVVNGLESDSAGKISKIQGEIRQSEIQATFDKSKANKDYNDQKREYERQTFEAQKAIMVAELRAQIAILRAKRGFWNKGRIDDAISAVNDSISDINNLNIGYDAPKTTTTDNNGNLQVVRPADELRYMVDMNKAGGRDKIQGGPGKPIREDTLELLSEGGTTGLYYKGNPALTYYNPDGKRVELTDGGGNKVMVAFTNVYIPATGEQLFKGTDFVQGLGLPDGIDTVPAMLTKGERVLTVDQNAALSGISNDEVVERIKYFDVLQAQFPDRLDPARWSDIVDSTIQIPKDIMNGPAIDISQIVNEMQGFRSDLKEVRRVIEGKKETHITMDKGGFGTYTVGLQSKINRKERVFKD